jgi:hypothetical protein
VVAQWLLLEGVYLHCVAVNLVCSSAMGRGKYGQRGTRGSRGYGGVGLSRTLAALLTYSAALGSLTVLPFVAQHECALHLCNCDLLCVPAEFYAAECC